MKYKENTLLPAWDPVVYDKLAIAQRTSVLKILEHLTLKNTFHILDVGCGDGKISADLAKIVSEGRVLGIDKSHEMIDYAIAKHENLFHSNLSFSLQDASSIDFLEQFDVVFSSFALQWIKDKSQFFTRTHAALKKGGQVCTICPLGISPELELATRRVIESSQWSDFYTHFHPGWHFVSKESLFHLVSEAFFKIHYSHTYIQEVAFPSQADFEKYILLWYPYLTPLKASLKPLFFAQVVDEYFKLLPPKKTGEVRMRIPTALLVAKKVNP